MWGARQGIRVFNAIRIFGMIGIFYPFGKASPVKSVQVVGKMRKV